ncbi:MAG: AmmeMemoRadiSam system protein A [Firmicutes bacterium]|nr:AmmeMemoRadiSam system protein A [Bacillota bacterium]
MSIVQCGVLPHPPIAVPEVGKGEDEKVKDTQQAALELGRRIKDSGAEVLVIISPHSPLFADAIALNKAKQLKGSLANFGAPSPVFEFNNAPSLLNEIVVESEKHNLVAVGLDQELAEDLDVDLSLDHGVTVPLYFLQQAGVELPLVVSSMSMFSFEQLYRFGSAVANAANKLNKKVALLASADLSHRLTPDAPAGYEPSAAQFDKELVSLVQSVDVMGLMNLDKDRIERAGECGLRPIIMMMGALDGKDVQSEVLSYEGPFGVGYMVASLKPGADNNSRRLLEQIEKQRQSKVKNKRKNESFIVTVARSTLENYVLGKTPPKITPIETPDEFKGAAGTFVSIKKEGQLRGCIGSVFPQQKNIVQEVMHNAINAGIHDPRFYPVGPEELDELTYSVDVLTNPELVTDISKLDPKKHGVIVKQDDKSGLLLPDLEGIETVGEQVKIAKEKAGINPQDENIQLESFEVIRYL